MEIKLWEPVYAILHGIRQKHYETIIKDKELLNNQLEVDSYTAENIKKGKAVGINKIPDEALMHLHCIRLLYTFLNFVLQRASHRSMA